MFEGSEDWGMRSGEDVTAVFGKKSQVEVVKMLQSKASIFCAEVEEIPIDPMDL